MFKASIVVDPDQAPTYDRITAEEAKKIMDSFQSMERAATSEKMSMKGERTAVRMIIW